MIINYVCRASKAKKDGLSPLELSIIINGSRKYITLDRNVNAANFDSKKQKVKGDAAINEYMVALKAKCYGIETEMMKNGMDVTMASFVDILKNGFKANTITILQLFRKHNELFGKKIANGVVTGSTLEKYKITMGYVAAYIKTLKKDDIMVKEITPMFIEDFFVYLKCCFSHLKNLCKALHNWQKEEKSLLRMDKCQSRHFAAQIAHVSITCLQYNFLSVKKRFSDYETIGELFRGTKEDALEVTIAERILYFIINVAAELEDEFDCDTDKLIYKLIHKPESKLLFVKIYEKVVA